MMSVDPAASHREEWRRLGAAAEALRARMLPLLGRIADRLNRGPQAAAPSAYLLGLQNEAVQSSRALRSLMADVKGMAGEFPSPPRGGPQAARLREAEDQALAHLRLGRFLASIEDLETRLRRFEFANPQAGIPCARSRRPGA